MRKELKLQQELIQTGIGFRTKVLNILKESRQINGYIRVCMMVMLRVNGKIIRCRLKTLVKENEIPHEGERILVRYKNGRANHVLVSALAA